MRRISAILTLLFLLTACINAVAQTYFTSTEVGVALGGSQYFGDLNEKRGLNTISAAGGIYARKHLNQFISVKLLANYTSVEYDDKYNTAPYHKERNLNFKSDVYELAMQAEFNFFRFVTGDPYHRFTPFLTGGIGAFYYDPYTTLNGTKYFLRPLGTEGQFSGFANRKYTNVGVCVPIGIGVKVWVKGGVNLTLELADRLTRTDYLDDVSATYVGSSKFPSTSVAYQLQDRSPETGLTTPLGRPGKQRGNTSSFDQYMLVLLSVSWHFTTYRCPSFMDNDLIKTY